MSVTLSEAESRRLAAHVGVPVSPFVTATHPDEAVAAAAGLDRPLVAKLCGRAIAHKTERGLVRLRLADDAALAAATAELLGAATADDGPVEVLVSTMVAGNREFIAGTTVDPTFGPVAMIGVGGILAEAVRDVAFRLVPLEPVDAEEMIDDLSTRRLLDAFRGEPPVDRAALVDALVAVSRLATEVPGVVSVDLNPLIISEGRPVAVDALVEVDDPDAALAVVEAGVR